MNARSGAVRNCRKLLQITAPLGRTVRVSGAGLVFEAGDPGDCATKVAAILTAPESLDAWGEYGFRCVLEQGHNWNGEPAPAPICMYDELLAAGT